MKKKIDIAIIRIFQFLLLMFFTFAVFLYYGAVLMLALAIWNNLSTLFAMIFGAFLSAILGLAALLGICYYIAKFPGLVAAYLDSGMELIRLGHRSLRRLGALLEDPLDAAGKAQTSSLESNTGTSDPEIPQDKATS